MLINIFKKHPGNKVTCRSGNESAVPVLIVYEYQHSNSRRRCWSRHRERKCADTIGTVPVPWAGHFQCWNINIFFSNKTYGSNFIKEHSGGLKLPKCWSQFKKTITVSFIVIFGTLSFRTGWVTYILIVPVLVNSDDNDWWEAERVDSGESTQEGRRAELA